MKNIKISHLDLDLYTEKLDNGLEIYVVPKLDISDTYVTYTTQYGASIIDFSINGEQVNVPYGVAHFLEHKMFEQEDGVSPFEQFEKNGASANAFTNYFQTTYLWCGPNNFEDNMKTLINYVNNPYFTDKNVEKEKGIIIQEIKMYDDSPFRRGFRKIRENILINSPVRYDVGGTIESVNSITKEDLYKCYNAFYDPSNMFIVISGNVEPEEAIKVIKKYYKKTSKNNKISVKKYEEPLKIVKKKETLNMNVTVPKFFLGFKFDITSYNLDKKRWIQYLMIYFDALIGPTSDFSSNLTLSKTILGDMDFYVDYVDNCIFVTVLAETKHLAKLEKLIKEEVQKKIKKEVFERKKKYYLSSTIKLTDNIAGINKVITGEIINYNYFNKNIYNQIKDLNYEDFNKFIKHLDFSNTTSLYIKPIKEK